jgi:anaerobic glycerol-3-phosphate dehydrogenase
MQPLARRSARLAAKPRHNYAHAEAQLDAAVEKYVDPDAYAAKKARAARREEVRQAEIARLVRQAKARKAVAQDIADVASEIINIRSKCLTFDKFHMWWLEREVKELVAKAQPTWTPANLQWAYSYVTDRQTT